MTAARFPCPSPGVYKNFSPMNSEAHATVAFTIPLSNQVGLDPMEKSSPARKVLPKAIYKHNMKIILLFTCVISLLFTTGCLVEEGGGHRHERYEEHSAVIVGPPVVEVRVPEVEVRPPEVIVR
jgi:hypothetical protein